MDDAIDAFVADPTDATLEAAKQAWLDARDDYGLTEAFRFYGGPIDNEEDGPEGLHQRLADGRGLRRLRRGRSRGRASSTTPPRYPTIDADAADVAQRGGRRDQHLHRLARDRVPAVGPGPLARTAPARARSSDYVDAANADRRGQYLTVASDLLLTHLQALVDAWSADTDGNYRAEFLELDPEEAMTNIITGIGELSRGELGGRADERRLHAALAGGRALVLLRQHHRPTSSPTPAASRWCSTASYPGGVEGTSVLDVIAAEDEDLAAQLESEVAASVAAVSAIPAPFDQHLRDGVPDSDPGRASVLAGIEALEAQTPDDRRRRRGARAHDQRHLSGIDGEPDRRSSLAAVAARRLRMPIRVGRRRSPSTHGSAATRRGRSSAATRSAFPPPS